MRQIYSIKSIATWNVNSLRVRLAHLSKWLAENPVDIIALQETKTPNNLFPAETIHDLGYQVSFHGQKSYNGIAILSRYPQHEIKYDYDVGLEPQCRFLAATIQNIRVINIYVPNGAAVGSDKYNFKLEWLSKLREILINELANYEKVVVLGDFNIAPTDQDVHDPAAWHEQILCSSAEREKLMDLFQIGFKDIFRQFNNEAEHFSWWDYRQAAFRRNLGLRIDLILMNEALSRSCTSCIIDPAPRRAERPSDHTPVIAHFT